MFGEKIVIRLEVLLDEGRRLEFRLKQPKESVAEDYRSKTSKLTGKLKNHVFPKRNAINPFPNLTQCVLRAIHCSINVGAVVRQGIKRRKNKHVLPHTTNALADLISSQICFMHLHLMI